MNILALNPYKNYSESSTLAPETLHLHSSRTTFLLPATSIGHAYKKQAKQAQLRTKHYKNPLKERARSYYRQSARNTKNGATVEKTQLSKDLYYSRKENYKLDLFYL